MNTEYEKLARLCNATVTYENGVYCIRLESHFSAAWQVNPIEVKSKSLDHAQRMVVAQVKKQRRNLDRMIGNFGSRGDYYYDEYIAPLSYSQYQRLVYGKWEAPIEAGKYW